MQDAIMYKTALFRYENIKSDHFNCRNSEKLQSFGDFS